MTIPQWDSQTKDIDKFRDSSDIAVDDFYSALFEDDGMAIDFPNNEKRLIKEVFEKYPKTEIAKITAYSHDNITAMIVGEFEEKATLTERAKDKWQAFWKKVKGVFKGKPSPEDSQDGQPVQEEDSSATDLEKDKKTGLLSKAKGWLKNVRNKWRERREQRRSKKEPQESEGAGQEGSSSDEENMGFSYNTGFRLGQLLKKVRERRGARKEKKQARSEQADSSDLESSGRSYNTGFRIGRFLRNIKDRWTSRRESKKAAREAGEVDEESEDSLSSSERRSQQVEKLINQLSLISLDSLEKLGIVKKGVNIEERRPGQLSQEIEMFRGQLVITRSNIKSNLDVLKSLEERHSRLSGKSDEEGNKENLERISVEIEKTKQLLEQLKQDRASIIGKLANRYSQLARIEKKAESDQSTPELNLSVEHLSFNPANRRKTEKILEIAVENMDESVEDHQKIIDALQRYLYDLEQITFGPLERIRKQPITQRFGKIMDAMRGWFAEKWEKRPRSYSEWNRRRREKSRKRWEGAKQLYDKKAERWRSQLEIENVPQEDLNAWELSLRQGETLGAKEIVALVLDQRIGWMPELKKHRAVLKEAGIDLQNDLMDWLRFQWEKKLTDERNEAVDNVRELKDQIEGAGDEGERKRLEGELKEARSARTGSDLRLINLKFYNIVRHWAPAEAGVDRMGRPNLSGVAKEDLKGEGLKKFWNEVRSYLDIRNLSRISNADRNAAYHLTYFPSLIALLTAPFVTAASKHIAMGVLNTANVVGEDVRRKIEVEHNGNAEAYWLEMSEKKGVSNRVLMALMRAASSRTVEGMQRGLAGAAGAASVAEILNLREVAQGLRETLSRQPDGSAPLPEEIQQLVDEYPDLQEQIDSLSNDLAEAQEELVSAQETIRELELAPEVSAPSAPDVAPEVVDSVVEEVVERVIDSAELMQQATGEQLLDNSRHLWSSFEADNAGKGVFTRMFRGLNPTARAEAINRAGSYNWMTQEAFDTIAQLANQARDGSLPEAAKGIEDLLLAGHRGVPGTFTSDQANKVLEVVAQLHSQ